MFLSSVLLPFLQAQNSLRCIQQQHSCQANPASFLALCRFFTHGFKVSCLAYNKMELYEKITIKRWPTYDEIKKGRYMSDTCLRIPHKIWDAPLSCTGVSEILCQGPAEEHLCHWGQAAGKLQMDVFSLRNCSYFNGQWYICLSSRSFRALAFVPCTVNTRHSMSTVNKRHSMFCVINQELKSRASERSSCHNLDAQRARSQMAKAVRLNAFHCYNHG